MYSVFRKRIPKLWQKGPALGGGPLEDSNGYCTVRPQHGGMGGGGKGVERVVRRWEPPTSGCYLPVV